MVGLGGQMGVEIKTNSAQLMLEFWLSLAKMDVIIKVLDNAINFCLILFGGGGNTAHQEISKNRAIWKIRHQKISPKITS